MSLHGLYRASGQVKECQRFEFGHSIQTATVYIRTISVYNSWLGCCCCCSRRVSKEWQRSSALRVQSFVFPPPIHCNPFFFYSILLFTRALWYFWTISKSLRQERRKEFLTPPRPKKERGCCPSSAPGQLASQQQRRQVYIYTSTKASAEPCRACQVERSSSTYRCVEVKCVFSYSSFLSSESWISNRMPHTDGSRQTALVSSPAGGCLDRLTRISLGSVWLIYLRRVERKTKIIKKKKKNGNSLICRLFKMAKVSMRSMK